MSKKATFVFGFSFVIASVIAYQSIQFIRRSRPRQAEGEEAVRMAASDILAMKCADCHDGTKSLPFYAKIPVVSSFLRKHVDDGLRHWDWTDRRYLGPGAMTLGTPPPQAVLAKLFYVLKDQDMPPMNYRFAHWGTGLTESEEAILEQWIVDSSAAWLKKAWGLSTSGFSTVHPLPERMTVSEDKVVLGQALYNDKRLSVDGTVSCATCHDLKKGATDQLQYSVGVQGKKGGLNAPTAFNAMGNLRQFWDGRAADLAAQAGGPPLNPVEMASKDWAQICAKFDQDAAFKKQFTAVYSDGFSEKNICNAIAEYERTFVTPNSRFDQFLRGKKDALNEVEKRGWKAFQERRCDRCHVGPAMGGQSFESITLKGDGFFAGRKPDANDAGLAAFSKDPRDQYRFKVPTLRNIALTHPYLHDGRTRDLSETIRVVFDAFIGEKPEKEEVEALTAFLGTLTGMFRGAPLK